MNVGQGWQPLDHAALVFGGVDGAKTAPNSALAVQKFIKRLKEEVAKPQ
jgi:hypothetical protein